MQISSQYVAYGIHMISSLSGGLQTAIVSHSQGGPVSQWALRFWPSTRNITRAFVPLSPDFAGIELAGSQLSNFCSGDLCQDCIWQQSAGSNYLAALHDDTFGMIVPTTAIWTQSDGVVNPPQQNAQLPGAVSFPVQAMCPGRPVNHIQMTTDSAAYALALDALNHGGVGNAARAQKASWLNCFHITAPNMQVSVVAALTADWNDVTKGILGGSQRVSEESAVQAYALNPTST